MLLKAAKNTSILRYLYIRCRTMGYNVTNALYQVINDKTVDISHLVIHK